MAARAAGVGGSNVGSSVGRKTGFGRRDRGGDRGTRVADQGYLRERKQGLLKGKQ